MPTVSQYSTRQKIMEVAQELLQSKGFHAFSYADISERVGIRKASIHHHFASKNDLGEALVEHYRGVFTQARAHIDEANDQFLPRLLAYVALYRNALQDHNRMCLCGMLAADFMTLTEIIQTQVRAFMSENAAWLAQTLESARTAKELTFEGSAQKEAEVLLSSLEGGMLIARSMGGVEQFDHIVEQVFVKYK